MLRFNMKLEVESSLVDKIASAAQGLTLDKIKDCLAKSIPRNKVVDESVIYFLSEKKGHHRTK